VAAIFVAAAVFHRAEPWRQFDCDGAVLVRDAGASWQHVSWARRQTQGLALFVSHKDAHALIGHGSPGGVRPTI
jgi:hypothetical protein